MSAKRDMVQLYQKQPLSEELVPCPDSLIEVLTGADTAIVYKQVDNGLPRKDNQPFAIHVPDHARGFGDCDKRKYYEIDVEGRRIFDYNASIFRHLDKTGQGKKYFIEEKVGLEDFVEDFKRGGYTIMNRIRNWGECLY